MNGQWLGSYTGSTTGELIVNVDERSSFYEGSASLIEHDPKLPNVVVSFRTNSKDPKFNFRTTWLSIVHPILGTFHTPDDMKSFYPDFEFSSYVEGAGQWDANFLNLSWKAEKGAVGECKLSKSRAHESSRLVSQQMDWAGYKLYSAQFINKKHIFRGQEKPWRLRTSYHRKGRSDLFRYTKEDILLLHRHLTARTKHVFNLEIPDQNGSFYNLIQHHGYPTPLLDWTYSPYVAAFFAYSALSNKEAGAATEDHKVRIHVFDQELWKDTFPQYAKVLLAKLHFSVCEFIAIENERMIPQQAASTITNVDDVEEFIAVYESNATKFLWAIDLPVRERSHVMRELSHMGITAGSLFPGLDGACKELAERNFDF